MNSKTPQVHEFETTSDAYNASQWRDDILNGDVLHVPSEGVIGVLIGAWPVAVVAEGGPGSFHELAEGSRFDAIERTCVCGLCAPHLAGSGFADSDCKAGTDDYSASAALARQLVDRPVCAVCKRAAAEGITEATDASPELPRCYHCMGSTAGGWRPFEQVPVRDDEIARRDAQVTGGNVEVVETDTFPQSDRGQA